MCRLLRVPLLGVLSFGVRCCQPAGVCRLGPSLPGCPRKSQISCNCGDMADGDRLASQYPLFLCYHGAVRCYERAFGLFC